MYGYPDFKLLKLKSSPIDQWEKKSKVLYELCIL